MFLKTRPLRYKLLSYYQLRSKDTPSQRTYFFFVQVHRHAHITIFGLKDTPTSYLVFHD